MNNTQTGGKTAQEKYLSLCEDTVICSECGAVMLPDFDRKGNYTGAWTCVQEIKDDSIHGWHYCTGYIPSLEDLEEEIGYKTLTAIDPDSC